MKTELTQARLKEILDYNPETGLFYRKISTSMRPRIGVAGGKCSRGYIRIKVDGEMYYGHRLAWLYMTGEWPKDQIDHVDGIKSNNRFHNLREANKSQNMQNQKKARSGNTSGLLGVGWHKTAKKWRARIVVNGDVKSLGFFDCKFEAHGAYMDAKVKLHKYCAISGPNGK